MSKQTNSILVLTLAAMVLAGCEAAKSSNPTSPSVAGPIAGVNITAPSPVAPGTGTTIPAKEQPITLTIQNSTTNGQRPITYTFEVAVDGAFANKVVTREGVEPGGDGKTAFRLPDALAADRTYYWRAKAVDGANQSSYSEAPSFAVVVIAEIQAPLPLFPIGAVAVSSLSPEFGVANSARTGPAGAIAYVFEISENESFTAMVAAVTVAEKTSPTRFTLAQQLKASTKHYWRVRAFDVNVTSPWSLTQSFVTPKAVAVPPPAPPPAPGAACNSSNPDTIIKCERAKYGHMSDGQLLEFVRASAKSLNRNAIPGGAFGILRKSGGANCGGYSCDIICADQGTNQRQHDVLGDAEGAQVAGWGSPKTYPNIRVDVCEIQ